LSVEKDKATSSRRYLLGALSAEESERLEGEFFDYDETFEEIEIAEDELIDDYLGDDLSRAERDQFQKQLLGNPRIAERVEFAKVLRQASKTPVQPTAIKPEPNSWWQSLVAFFSTPQRLGGAVAVLALVVGGGFLFVDWLRLRDESRRLIAERAVLQRENELLARKIENDTRQLTNEKQNVEALNTKLEQELENAQERPSPLALLSPLFIFPGASRSTGKTNDLILPSRSAMVRLQLALEANDYLHYNAVVRRGVEGPIAFRRTNLKPATSQWIQVIELRFPSTRLVAPGDYTINLDGVKPPGKPEFVATYDFRTVSK
jgi:hypothetical protein